MNNNQDDKRHRMFKSPSAKELGRHKIKPIALNVAKKEETKKHGALTG